MDGEGTAALVSPCDLMVLCVVLFSSMSCTRLRPTELPINPFELPARLCPEGTHSLDAPARGATPQRSMSSWTFLAVAGKST